MCEVDIEQRHEEMNRAAAEFTTDKFDELVSNAGHKNTDVRMLTATRLTNSEDTRTVPVLIKLLEDSSARVRGAAVIALGQREAEEARESLVEHLQSDQSGDVRAFCAVALGYIGGADQHLVRALEDPDPHARISAVNALSNLGISDAAEQIARLLDDPDCYVRYFACLALLDFGVSNARVVGTLTALRDVPEACAVIMSHAESEPLTRALEKFEGEMDEFDDEASMDDMLEVLRARHGESEVPRPAQDPLGDLIERAAKMLT